MGRMNTPSSAIDWLKEKCERGRWSSVHEARIVTREWVRYTGGRVLRAGVTGAIEPSENFGLVVHAEAIELEYAAAARNAALTVLLSQSWSPVLAVKLTLSEFRPHPEESSYAAFYAVAHEVVSCLLGVAPDTLHNIEW